jgi:molecular chaperone HtpG
MAQTAQKKDVPHTESMEFSAEISKVLKLMIHSLYTNKDIFLRELISNASDACDKLRYQSLTNQSLLGDATELSITIEHDEEARTITVTDTGIGMNREDMIAHLGTIAKSGTEEFAKQLSGDKEKDVSLIGQFGVGFYSAFMVADKVDVISRKAGEQQGWHWSSEGNGKFDIAPTDTEARGTSIILYMRDDAKDYLDTFKLRHIVETYSDHISFPIYQIPIDYDGKKQAAELINDRGALWTRPKSDITDEQYKEFYNHVSHSPDAPWAVLHNTAEGKASYTNLLFIPSMKPFDLFHPERRRRVKLYVKRVFISDENVELVPHYMRFLRGVIDSDDLPLNISRETLQDNPKIRQIRESVTNKTLSELKKKADKSPEDYLTFWNMFGAVLKEGLCEIDAPKDKILDVCRFISSETGQATSLTDYISRKKDAQEHIFYITADSIEAAQKSPLLEGFKKRGIEVLLFSDHVDDFWVNVVGNYQDIAFKSVTRSDINLDDIVALKDERNKDGAKDAIDKDSKAVLIAKLKVTYGESIKDVRETSKLTDTLACLAVDEGAMDMRMERFMMDHNQLPRRSAKILEVNLAHPFYDYLAIIANDESKAVQFKECAELLVDQARIIEGEHVGDPAQFAKRFASLMQKAFA